jgi:tetratricopeptide (TPR) repeat protein
VAANADRQHAGQLIASGLTDQAEQLLRAVLKRNPKDHEAMAMLAQVLIRRRAFDEAQPLIQRAISADRKRADYHALSGELHIVIGKPTEALSRFDAALKLHPAYDAAIAGRTDALLRLGRYDDALKTAQSGPDTPVLAGIHARALRRSGNAEAARAIAERHTSNDAQRGNTPLELSRTLWFELGHACTALGDVSGAHDAFLTANARSIPPEATLEDMLEAIEAEADRQLDVLLEAFSSEAWPTLPQSEVDADLPVLIVGLPRCGSTLVEQIIASHPNGAGAGELETLPAIATTMQTRLGARLPFPACLAETNEHQLTAVALDYLKVLRHAGKRATRVVDKQLGNMMFVGLAGLLLPKARVIHCTRHPMDLGLSCWTQKFPPGTNLWATDQAAIARQWHRSQRLMDHWANVEPLPMLEVCYERLVEDLEVEVRRILAFVGLPFDEACLQFWKTKRTVLTLSHDQVRRPLYASSVGRHKAWGDLLGPMRDVLGDAVGRYENR